MAANLTKATYRVTAVELSCPACGELVAAPSGSLFWTTEELAQAKREHAIGQVCQNPDCKAVVRFPRIYHS